MGTSTVPEKTVKGSRGELRLWNPAPGVFCSEAKGVLDDVHGDAFCAFGDAVMAGHGGTAVGVHDWIDMKGYSPAVRRAVTRWSTGVISDLAEVHIHLRSKVVAMGVSVANTVLNNKIRVHQDRETFAATVDELIARAHAR